MSNGLHGFMYLFFFFSSFFSFIFISCRLITLHMYLFKLTFLSFFGCIPRSGIVRSYGSSIPVFWGISLLFSTLASAIYISHQQCTKGSFSPHSHQHFLFVFFFDEGHSDAIYYFWEASSPFINVCLFVHSFIGTRGSQGWYWTREMQP